MGGRRRASILDRHDYDSVLRLDEDIHEDQPSPRSEDEPKTIPASGERWADVWELSERSQRPGDPCTGVRWEAVRADQAVEILDGCDREFDASHSLKLVQ